MRRSAGVLSIIRCLVVILVLSSPACSYRCSGGRVGTRTARTGSALHGQSMGRAQNTPALRVSIIPGPVVEVLPFLKLHHFVVVESMADEGEGAYILDFSPADKRSPFVLMRMLLGKDVPARLRTEYIPCRDRVALAIASDLMDVADSAGSKATTRKDSIDTNPDMINALRIIRQEWNGPINLYTRNCQDFSRFVRELVRS